MRQFDHMSLLLAHADASATSVVALFLCLTLGLHYITNKHHSAATFCFGHEEGSFCCRHVCGWCMCHDKSQPDLVNRELLEC
jgi:hypothetical protein